MLGLGRSCALRPPSLFSQACPCYARLGASSFARPLLRTLPPVPDRAPSCSVPPRCCAFSLSSSSAETTNQNKDCAACQDGYGKAVGSTCHSCEDAKSRWLIFAGALFILIALLFLLLAIIFLVGGLDAVEQVRLSISRRMSVSSNMAPSFWKNARDTNSLARVSAARNTASYRAEGNDGGLVDFAPAFAAGSDDIGEGEGRQPQQRYLSRSDKHIMPRRDFSDKGSSKEEETRSSNTVVDNMGGPRLMGAGAASTVTASYANRNAAGGSTAIAVPSYMESDQLGESERGKSDSACCGLGDKIKRWASLIPLGKLKILVVVWQILTVFPSITGTDFPPSYSRFLSWIDIVNLDLGSIVSGTCILPQVSFYERLLVTTLGPLGLVVLLALTYQLAKRRAGIGSASVVAKRAAWSRHIAAGLLLTFLVSSVERSGGSEVLLCLMPPSCPTVDWHLSGPGVEPKRLFDTHRSSGSSVCCCDAGWFAGKHKGSSRCGATDTQPISFRPSTQQLLIARTFGFFREAVSHLVSGSCCGAKHRPFWNNIALHQQRVVSYVLFSLQSRFGLCGV